MTDKYNKCGALAPLVIAIAAQWAAAGLASAESLNEASSSRQSRQEAIRSIPFDKLTDAMQHKLRAVVDDPSLYRRMPVEAIESDPDMYLFLVRHPEVIVDTWKLMGITKVTINRTSQFTMSATDGLGTESNIELVYGTPDLHVMYAEGTYEGPLFRKKVSGRCVLVLKSGYTLANQRSVVLNQLDVFIRLDNVGAELLAKTLHPVVGKSADYNFNQTTTFISRISQAAESNGPGVQRLADRLPNTTPEVRRRFAELALLVSHRAALRDHPPTLESSPEIGIPRTSSPMAGE